VLLVQHSHYQTRHHAGRISIDGNQQLGLILMRSLSRMTPEFIYWVFSANVWVALYARLL
jgi:hypothetical protein